MVPRRFAPLSGSVASLVLLAGAAAAQRGPPSNPAPEYGLGIGVSFVVQLVVGLLLGGIVLAAAPDYTDRTVRRLRRKPVDSFVVGLLVTVGLVVAVVLFAITVVGLIVAVPLVIGMIVVGIVGTAVATVALGMVLLSTDDWTEAWKALAVGVLVTSVLGVIPLLGGLVNFLVGTTGLGVVAHQWWENRGDGGSSGQTRASISRP